LSRDVDLGCLLAGLAARGFRGRSSLPAALRVTGVQIDSRKVRSGDLFVALAGTRDDGARYASAALAAGAVAVVVGEKAGASASDLPAIVVDDVARAAGHIAAIVAGEPARSVALVGVTGTNGKTSCTYLLESVWHAAGVPCGVGGTIEQRGPGFARPARLTTPDAIELQAFLVELRAAGAKWAALEVSSHALAQHRVAGCVFRAAIFTNLTRDHLDYHADEEAYFAAKLALFTDYLARGDGVAVINADDARSAAIRRARGAEPVVTYSGTGAEDADVRVIADPARRGAARGAIVGLGRHFDFESRLFGDVNLANIAAVAAAALAIGIDDEAIAAGIASCAPVPGRLERIGGGDSTLFVDYAHTPDALERTLMAARHMTAGRVVVVFGCGGDRDRGKRPAMGEIAGRLADVVVLTSDNPRGEDPAAILAEIEAGIGADLPKRAPAVLGASEAVRGYFVESDRELAIRHAMALAHPRDVVVIAGKGHEDYQEIAGVRRPFDDRALARRILEGA
jgi:UDP-N-acetylmuramoyl-L-alanyl-D-glutamate--2,6-diaminopimelate ligase